MPYLCLGKFCCKMNNGPTKKSLLLIWKDSNFARELIEKIPAFTWFDINRPLAELKDVEIETGVLLPAEAAAGQHKRSDFYGFEILYHLRHQFRWSCPVGIASFMPLAYLRQRFPILDYPQHHPYLQLPAAPASVRTLFDRAEPAGQCRLNEIIRNYCDPVGRLIRLLTHGYALNVLYKKRQPGPHFTKKLKADIKLLERYAIDLSVPGDVHNLVRQLLTELKSLDDFSIHSVSEKLNQLVDQLAGIKTELKT